MNAMSMFAPAIALMRRQKYHYKFVVVGIGVLAAILFLLGSLSVSLWSSVEVGKRELVGLQTIKPTLRTMQLIQQHRGLAMAVLAGDDSLKDAADAKAAEVEASITRVDAELAAHRMPSDAHRQWHEVKEGWKTLASDWSELVRPITLTMYEEQIGKILAFIYSTGDASGVATDPSLDSYYLLGMSVYAMPEVIELVGRVGDAGADAYARKKMTDVQRAEFANRHGVIGRVTGDLGARLDRAASYNDALKPALSRFQERFVAGANDVLVVIDGDFTTGRLLNPPEYFAGKTGALIDLGYEVLFKELLPTAEQLIGDRLFRLRAEFVASLGIATILLAVCAYLSAGAYFAVMGDLGKLSTAAERFGQGDFEARVAVTSKDELAVVGSGFNTMADSVHSLVSKIKARTHDIQAMLENIPQGLLTVVADGKIHHEYSAYLERLFETGNIAGADFMELVFSGSDVGTDTVSQIQAVVSACIGEDRMNLDFNAHLLVTEFDKHFPEGRIKSLQLSWSPICNDDDVVEKLMVCIRDVTDMKALATEASQQRRELEIIGQILAVSQEKFHEFVDSAEKFIAENEALLASDDARRPEIIGELFRNMHTIKGNARTYGLLHVTNLVHEAEQTYDELRQHPDTPWDREKMVRELAQAREVIEEYARVNEVKLGRRGPGRRGGVEKYLMVEKEHIQDTLDTLALATKAGGEIETMRDAIRKTVVALERIGTETIGNILAGVLDSLPSLARELGKEAPHTAIEAHGIVVRTQIADLLRNVFMHLYRNSLDHGLETAAERTDKGKPAAGTIRLDLSLTDDHLLFRLADDGRGLAVGAIRRKAIDKGLIEEDKLPPPEVVAQLIFASGFSTAAQVTEISGRGVGMDAVKNFVEREGGKIELRFLDHNNADDFRPFETVIHFPRKFALETSA